MSVITETWLPIPGWEGYYEVSTDGRVRSLRAAGRELTRSLSSSGYLTVTLSRDGSSGTRTVHSLVAEAFIGPRPEGQHVCHNDGTRTNNAASNLRYDSPSANLLDAVAHGTHALLNRTHCPHGHEYTEANTYRQPGRSSRFCRACAKRRRIEFQARRSAALLEAAS